MPALEEERRELAQKIARDGRVRGRRSIAVVLDGPRARLRLDEGGELSDAGLVEFVQAEAARRGEEYAPPLEFYARLEEAMREEYL